MSQPLMVDARNISKRFGSNQALDNVSLQIGQAEIHALIGGNGAGKSTLVGAITGLLQPDSGEISFSGQPAPPVGDREAWKRNAACVYQYPTVVPSLSIAENLFLGNPKQRGAGLLDWQRMRAEAHNILGSWRLDLDVTAPASTLRVGERQIVEIARALLLGSRFVILDEPTAGLAAAEVKLLAERVRDLREEGVSFLYISHYMEEIFDLCDKATFLRDGKIIGTHDVADLDRRKAVELMVGKAAAKALEELESAASEQRFADQADVMLEVKDLETVPGQKVSFNVRKGEVLGLAGGPSSGNVSVAQRIAGLNARPGGSVRLAGTPLTPDRPDTNISRGLGFVPGDRYEEGMVSDMSIADNVSLPILNRVGKFGFSFASTRAKVAGQAVSELSLKADSLLQSINELSGGNQQKATLGRAIAVGPSALVLVRPTAGIDVAAKATIRSAIRKLAADSELAVLIVSDDPDDLRGCDSLQVMFKGRVIRHLPASWSEQQLVSAMEGIQEA
ncbi:sugar ABC transporter ATP-binding protein [Paenarthrobacter nicotinovorans]|uniref:sugar ABC transporter ATP-binding protein n=1 Tax=Paenarthrobacter nicotinovorans TaxID=29320 RepID=UPI0037F4DE52